MKFLLYFVLLFPLSFTSCAQEGDKKFERIYYTEKAEKYKRMKAGGIFFSVAGTIAAIYYVSIEPTNIDDKIAERMIAGTCAIGSLALGIPTWIVGATNQNKYKKKLENMSVSVRVSQRSSGLVLTYRF